MVRFNHWPVMQLMAAGLVVSLLAVPRADAMTANPIPEEATSLDAVARAFLPEAQWQRKDVEALQAEIRRVLDGGDGSSVFHPDADTGPLSKALLVLMSKEDVLPHTRWRLRYARARVAPDGQSPFPVALVEVARFNLGPARHAALVEQLGAAQVAPVEAFGQGEHVAWRFITRPVMGQVADMAHAARRELPLEEAGCLSAACASQESLNEQARDWPMPTVLGSVLAAPSLEVVLLEAGLERLGLIQRDGLGPARWQPPEWPEGVPAGEPLLEGVMERGLGQDGGVDLVLHLGPLMDDQLKALWQRVMAVETETRSSAQVWETQSREPWPRLE